MGIIENMVLAVGLAMDAFAVSLCMGATGRVSSRLGRLRLSANFGLFQALMPILGWYGGSFLARYISAFDHWVAFGLLAFVGGRMLISGCKHQEEDAVCTLLTGREELVLGIATSIDALAVGLSLAFLGVSVWRPSLVIGVITAGLSLLALFLGGRLGVLFGKRAEIFGGLVLLTIGARVLITHLTAA